ncbi:MAG TPA: hypothetical protein VLZ50_06525 [Terracidiphilus sp.]|nr:hypothetical protein [Terracidiphilus sp.]
MKKFVFASVMALATMSLVSAPRLQAQDQPGSISIKDPAEYNAYQMASSQSDPKAKAAALDSFLKSYPQSVVKSLVLNDLVNLYSNPLEPDKELEVSTQLLQIDPNNLRALLYSVVIKKMQAQQHNDQQAADDAAALAHKGLTVAKPAGTSDDEWKTLTAAAYPLFHSAIAFDDVVKKDFRDATGEYKSELMLYPDDQTKSGPGLVDTLNLAEAYVNVNPKKPDAKDLTSAVWFYARAWDYAPPAYKPQIEKKLDYWYSKYHGDTKGLDDVKTQAQASEFPPGTYNLAAAKTPQEIVHDLITSTPDLKSLALSDKETILAVGAKEDADRMWSVLQGQQTPVPGDVISATASAAKVRIQEGAAAPKEYSFDLKAPVECKDAPAEDADTKAKEDFVTSNGAGGDFDKLSTAIGDAPSRIRKFELDVQATVVNVAVTDDAKTSKVPDFIVNLKTPASCKDVVAGTQFGTQPKAELDGTYSTYKQIPATDTTTQSAQIVLNDGFVQAAQKTPAHKPAAGHRPARPGVHSGRSGTH